MRRWRPDARFARSRKELDERAAFPMLRLSGKVALITGGGTGIGRACALAFGREGAKVALAGRRREPLDAVVREIAAAGGEALALTCDVTETASVTAALSQTERHFGRLNTIVNNAGAVVVATVERTSDEDWEKVIAVNLTGTFMVSRGASGAASPSRWRLDREYRLCSRAGRTQGASGILRR